MHTYLATRTVLGLARGARFGSEPEAGALSVAELIKLAEVRDRLRRTHAEPSRTSRLWAVVTVTLVERHHPLPAVYQEGKHEPMKTRARTAGRRSRLVGHPAYTTTVATGQAIGKERSPWHTHSIR